MNKNSTIRDLAYIAVFAALYCVLGVVSIPTPLASVPLVLQNGAVIIGAIILGPRRGLLAALLFLVLAAGLPVLAGGRTLIPSLQGITVGYLIAYPIAAFVAGLIAYKAPRTKAGMFTTFAIASVVGLAIQYILGAIGLGFRSDMGFPAAFAMQLGFIVPDLPEVIAGIFIAVGAHSAFPDLRPQRRAPQPANA